MVHGHFKIDFFPSLNCYFWGCKPLQLYLFISGIYLQRFYSALYFLSSPFILCYFCALWIWEMQALSFYCLTFAKFFSFFIFWFLFSTSFAFLFVMIKASVVFCFYWMTLANFSLLLWIILPANLSDSIFTKGRG